MSLGCRAHEGATIPIDAHEGGGARVHDAGGCEGGRQKRLPVENA